MSGHFYINPSCFYLQKNDELYIQCGINYEFKLDKKDHAGFIKKLDLRDTAVFTLEELADEFTYSEIKQLFDHKVLIDINIDLEQRYSRTQCFFSFRDIGVLSCFAQKKVLILGAGALGTHILWLFGTTNISSIVVIDYDNVELSNLNRQLYYDEENVGQSKLTVIKDKVKKQNSTINLVCCSQKIQSQNDIETIVNEQHPDIIVAAIDTPELVHHWINTVCVNQKVPYVTGGFVEDKGVIGPTYVPNVTACYDCINRSVMQNTLIKSGVGATFSAITEYVASKLFLEAVKIMSGRVQDLSYGGKTVLYDWYSNSEIEATLPHKEKCETCKKDNIPPKTENIFQHLLPVYYVVSFIIPVVNILLNGNVIFVCVAIYLSNFIPTFCYKGQYKIAFYGSLLYILNTLQLTALMNFSALNLSGSIVTQIYTFVLLLLTMITISNITYLGIVYINRYIIKGVSNIKVYCKMRRDHLHKNIK